MEEFKIRVESPEHSKKIQEKLFELGYEWWFGEKEILNLDALFLYASYDGFFSDNNDEYSFSLDSRKEMKLVEKISYEFEEIKEKKIMEDIKILESFECEDGSLTLTMEVSKDLRNLLIDKGINAILADYLNEIKNKEKS